jgi:hypothetical protein
MLLQSLAAAESLIAQYAIDGHDDRNEVDAAQI